MKGRAILGQLAALVLLLTGAGASTTAAAMAQPVFTIISPPGDCELRWARRLSPEQLSEESRQQISLWTGCVRMRGLVVNGLFFPDADSYYRSGGQDLADAIGVYSEDPRLQADGSSFPRWVEVAGFFADCHGAYWVDGWRTPDDGYCKEGGGTFLIIKEVRVGEAFRPSRLASPEDRERVGDLIMVPSGDTAPRDARAVAGGWLSAIRSGDRQAYADLSFGSTLQGDNLAAARLLFEDRRLAWLRDLPADTPIQFFAYSYDRQADSAPYLYVGCVCREADCGGRWPISLVDAGLNAARPYACVEISQDFYKRGPWTASSRIDPRNMREPSRPRFAGR